MSAAEESCKQPSHMSVKLCQKENRRGNMTLMLFLKGEVLLNSTDFGTTDTLTESGHSDGEIDSDLTNQLDQSDPLHEESCSVLPKHPAGPMPPKPLFIADSPCLPQRLC